MEDEHYDRTLWERYEEEQRWSGWQGGYSKRRDPGLERLNTLNARSRAGRRQSYGDALDFESTNRGPYSRDVLPEKTGRGRPVRQNAGVPRLQTGSSPRYHDPTHPGPFAGVGPRGYRRSDARILEDVNERLAGHGWVDASRMEVQVQDGLVTLQGTVLERRMKRLAEDLAYSVPGVQEVENRLRLAGPPRA